MDEQEKKREHDRRFNRNYTIIYWLIIAVVYIIWSAATAGWKTNLVLWPVALVVWIVAEIIMKVRNSKEDKQ